MGYVGSPGLVLGAGSQVGVLPPLPLSPPLILVLGFGSQVGVLLPLPLNLPPRAEKKKLSDRFLFCVLQNKSAECKHPPFMLGNSVKDERRCRPSGLRAASQGLRPRRDSIQASILNYHKGRSCTGTKHRGVCLTPDDFGRDCNTICAFPPSLTNNFCPGKPSAGSCHRGGLRTHRANRYLVVSLSPGGVNPTGPTPPDPTILAFSAKAATGLPSVDLPSTLICTPKGAPVTTHGQATRATATPLSRLGIGLNITRPEKQ